MNDYNLLVFYTHSNLDPYAVTINTHMRSMTLNMNMKYFHSREMIQGLLLSRLNIHADDELLDAILNYPQDALDGKDVTVLF